MPAVSKIVRAAQTNERQAISAQQIDLIAFFYSNYATEFCRAHLTLPRADPDRRIGFLVVDLSLPLTRTRATSAANGLREEFLSTERLRRRTVNLLPFKRPCGLIVPACRIPVCEGQTVSTAGRHFSGRELPICGEGLAALAGGCPAKVWRSRFMANIGQPVQGPLPAPFPDDHQHEPSRRVDHQSSI